MTRPALYVDGRASTTSGRRHRPTVASNDLFRLIDAANLMAPPLRRLRSYGPCRGACSNGVEKPGPGADRRRRARVTGGLGELTVAVRLSRGTGRIRGGRAGLDPAPPPAGCRAARRRSARHE